MPSCERAKLWGSDGEAIRRGGKIGPCLNEEGELRIIGELDRETVLKVQIECF